MVLALLLWSWPVYGYTPANEVEKVTEPKKPLDVETYVKEYFKDTPILIRVAKCESQYRQWDKSGNVLQGIIDKDDTGVMQINKRYHLEASRSLGYDISTLQGNVQYAKYLYENQGTRPWNASRSCWSY